MKQKEKISINGVDRELETITIDGVTYLPMRVIAEELDMEVTYDEKTKKKSIISKSNTSNQPKKKIWLDAGHSSISMGASGNGISEMEYVTKVVLELGKLLDKDYIIEYSRKDYQGCNGAKTTSQDLNNRTKSANAFGADLFISIHNNCFSQPSANGLETLVFSQQSTQAVKLAKIVQQDLVKFTQMTDRGIKYRNDLAVLRDTNMEAILIELGFISNEKDASKLKGGSYPYQLAQVIANSIRTYFKGGVK